ncbi:MAG: hypothetical protein NWF00_01345 [Candidatus Bathyarchaeota archaeon]|nr:hypothetical protein [Candidatus Bathyarchaeota archaeon]
MRIKIRDRDLFEVRIELNRQEATSLLRELISECDDLLSVRGVSLSPVKNDTLAESGSYELHISCGLDEGLRSRMKAVLLKHQLSMKEKDTEVIVFRPKTDP